MHDVLCLRKVTVHEIIRQVSYGKKSCEWTAKHIVIIPKHNRFLWTISNYCPINYLLQLTTRKRIEAAVTCQSRYLEILSFGVEIEADEENDINRYNYINYPLIAIFTKTIFIKWWIIQIYRALCEFLVAIIGLAVNYLLRLMIYKRIEATFEISLFRVKIETTEDNAYINYFFIVILRK